MKIKRFYFFTFISSLAIHVSNAQCSFNIGNDTSFCRNSIALNFTINGPSGYNLYLWNTGESTASITIDTKRYFFHAQHTCWEKTWYRTETLALVTHFLQQIIFMMEVVSGVNYRIPERMRLQQIHILYIQIFIPLAIIQ